MKGYVAILSLFICSIAMSQTSITGVIKDQSQQGVPGATITIDGDSAAANTSFDGSFELKTSLNPPFTISVSSVGFTTSTFEVSKKDEIVAITINSDTNVLNEIVVSASRTPERILESPVTIERMGVNDIKKSASATFYDGLENLKEVQMNTSSLSFKSINTRGFATVANTRFMQLVDGMDNSSPLLNFVLGNLIGVSEIDVQSVELLPGASSALYGANAFNGILFMTSKSPFTHQGITAYAKYGTTSQQAAGTNDFVDYGVRMAKAFNKYIAAKANFAYMKGTEWHAVNYNDKTRIGIDRGNINYDGMNVYGDEVSTNIKTVGQALAAQNIIPAAAVNLLPDTNVSRTGYKETDLTDNKVSNTKIDFSLHIRPLGDEKLEVIWQSKFGYGNTVYQGANRYYLNNFFMQQHKLEFKGKNFFLRGYTTSENGGQSYDMLFTGINVNRKWKDDRTWFGQYAGAYVQSTLAGLTPEQSHLKARETADTGRFIPGSVAFKNAFNQVVSDADVLKGSKLADNSKIYHSDANYNFKDLLKFAEIQVGGSYRLYKLNSFGRIYTDRDSEINYNDKGAYMQVQKKLLEDKLKFTGSVRYDKSQNFDGNFSPRISFVYSAGQNKTHNFRGSFQTGFRNPTTQDQYIGFNVGTAVLLGSAPDNLSRYSELRGGGGIDGTISGYGQGVLTVANSGTPTNKVLISGENAYFNSYTKSSVDAFAAFAAANPGNTPGAAALLRKTNVDYVKPETVQAIELGYRGQIKGFNVDLNGYYNTYNDFIGNLTVIAPLYGKASESFDFATGATNTVPYASSNPLFNNQGVQSVLALANSDIRAFQLYTNTNVEIKSIGFGAGISRKVYKDFEIGVNYNYAEFSFDQSKDPSFEAGFNTPKHRIKTSISNEKLFPNFGFNISGRWNSEYLWQSSFADGTIEAATVIDAQMNYFFPSLKSIVKIGATNIGGKEYGQVVGAGLIGQQYFLSWTVTP